MNPAAQLARGAAALPAELRAACRDAVLAHRDAAGGFAGRAGTADDWYTGFAVRALALTGGAEAALARAAAWLAARPSPPGDLAAAQARAEAALTLRLGGRAVPTPEAAVRTALAAQSCGDGWAAPGDRVPSVCQAFLAVSALAALGYQPPRRRALLASVRACALAGGGYADRVGGTPQANATAAALALLPAPRPEDLSALAALQAPDGGVRAQPGLPAGDLLSSFAAAWALARHDALDRLRLGDLARFVQGCRHARGFGACLGDDGSDPEYVFYGLGVLGLLAAQAGRGTAPALSLRQRLLAWPPTRRLGWRL